MMFLMLEQIMAMVGKQELEETDLHNVNSKYYILL